MNQTRRNMLKAGAGGALALAAGRMAAHPGHDRRLLILGGTGFIGPHLTEQALAGGWQVTHFNRGKRDPDGVPGVETLLGDRKGQLDSLKGRQWDAVIDDTGYIPKFVKMSAEILAPNTRYALFVSSISAYASFAKPNDEGSATGVLENVEQEQITNESYGPMKALCEQYTRNAWGANCSIVRPGYIVGPLDPTDRFTWWPVRVARGGEMAVPGTPHDPMQVIDVRDLARFMLDLVERRVAGNFNAVTPPGELTTARMVESCNRVSGADTKFSWIDEDFLQQFLKPEEITFAPWNPVRGADAGASLTGISRSIAQGLRSRPLDETVRDTLAWHEARPAERRAALRSGIAAAREAELLAAWHARR
ncbi:MAG: NAD-dependent epimerase/dehydratase family protein [Gammaproteobacteria bacterium]